MGEVCLSDESMDGEYDYVASVTRSYNMHEYATRALAEAALFAFAPLVDPDYSNLTRKSFSSSSVTGYEDEWTGTVVWEEYDPPVVGQETLTGSISVTSQVVKQTFRHVASYGPDPLVTPGFSGLINATPEGPEGAAIDIPVVTFTITKQYAKGTFTTAFLANATAYVGLPNTIAWRNFASGEVKLVGVDGSSNAGQFDPVSYQFSASPTFNGIVIPSPLGNITVTQKLGWQYLHIQYRTFTDPVSGLPTQVPFAAHVDELTPGVNLNLLLT
jgi:hypothetical protein